MIFFPLKVIHRQDLNCVDNKHVVEMLIFICHLPECFPSVGIPTGRPNVGSIHCQRIAQLPIHPPVNQHAAPRITCPGHGRYPDACFDQIFTSGLGKTTALVFRAKGSDHLRVMVDVVLGNEGKTR